MNFWFCSSTKSMKFSAPRNIMLSQYLTYLPLFCRYDGGCWLEEVWCCCQGDIVLPSTVTISRGILQPCCPSGVVQQSRSPHTQKKREKEIDKQTNWNQIFKIFLVDLTFLSVYSITYIGLIIHSNSSFNFSPVSVLYILLQHTPSIYYLLIINYTEKSVTGQSHCY